MHSSYNQYDTSKFKRSTTNACTANLNPRGPGGEIDVARPDVVGRTDGTDAEGNRREERAGVDGGRGEENEGEGDDAHC